jgi:hypothetical protein
VGVSNSLWRPSPCFFSKSGHSALCLPVVELRPKAAVLASIKVQIPCGTREVPDFHKLGIIPAYSHSLDSLLNSGNAVSGAGLA